MLRSVCVFCGSATGVRPERAALAAAFGRSLAHRGIELVFGGGHVGLMGALADGALAVGGRVVGVIPGALAARELAHPALTELHVVDTMHERKAKMASLADAFVVLPGGIGTLDELFEAWTWAQLGLHHKPLGLFDPGGYYGPLLAMVDAMVAEGFLAPEHRQLLVVSPNADALLDHLAARL